MYIHFYQRFSIQIAWIYISLYSIFLEYLFQAAISLYWAYKNGFPMNSLWSFPKV